MRDTTAKFKAPDTEKDKKELLGRLLNEASYHRTADLYCDYVKRYSGMPFYRFLPWVYKDSKKYQKKIAQIKKLIEITVDLGAPVEIYIRAQFEEQMPFLSKRKLRYVPFNNMITPRAIERFEEYCKRIDESYERTSERVAEFFRESGVNIRESIANSSQRFKERLKVILSFGGKLTKEVVIYELELLARVGAISNIYIYSHPLSRKSGSTFLNEMIERVESKLSEAQLTYIMEVRKDLKVGKEGSLLNERSAI